MSWVDIYRKKCVTAEEALSNIKDREMIVPSHNSAEPRYLFSKLCEMKSRWTQLGILQGLNIGDALYAKDEMYPTFINWSFFPGKKNRDYINSGRGQMIPMHFYAQPIAMREGDCRVDVGFLQVTPPDDDGYVWMGTSCDQVRVILDSARITIAQVNRYLPHVMGETRIPVDDIDYYVEYDEPIYEMEKIPSGDKVAQKIGENIAELIEDGACLQMGQGKIPNAILPYLENKKDLGIHTEVFSDNLLPLIEKGVITGAKKNIDTGLIVATFVQGSPEFYKFVDYNPMVKLMPVEYTNSVRTIAQLDKVVAINSAIEVDAMGQVAADSIGARMFSGVGGQQDFIRGAEESKGGKPIIALPSTTKNGEISRIVGVLKPGTPVTTTRNDVHYVVTEYGAANLFGKSLNQRCKALIEIADPSFREQIERDFYEYRRNAGQIYFD